MNIHTREHLSDTPLATWTERRPGVFDLRLNEHATFLVTQEGARYEILLPGHGREKCWNRAQAERLAWEHHENPMPDDDDADEEAGPSPESLLRDYHGRVL